jgi:hypothetical protein
MGKTNSKELILNTIKKDSENELRTWIIKEQDLLFKDECINKRDTHQIIHMAAFYGSINAMKLLINQYNCDVNCKTKSVDKSTPLIIACQRNKKEIVMFLLETNNLKKQKIDFQYKNNMGLNALDYSIVHGNYEIAYYLITLCLMKQERTLSEYIELNRFLALPLFNIPLFIHKLDNRVEFKNAPLFNLTKDETRDLTYKLPDPNETWAEFLMRILRWELYQPPLVDRRSVTSDEKKSIYMKMQTKLLEIEFNKKSNK